MRQPAGDTPAHLLTRRRCRTRVIRGLALDGQGPPWISVPRSPPGGRSIDAISASPPILLGTVFWGVGSSTSAPRTCPPVRCSPRSRCSQRLRPLVINLAVDEQHDFQRTEIVRASEL